MFVLESSSPLAAEDKEAYSIRKSARCEECWSVVSQTVSVKIVRRGFRSRHGQWTDSLGFHRNHVVLILQAAFDQQKLLVHDGDGISLKKLRRDDGVGNPGFVFQAQKHEALRRSGPLPRNHRGGYTNKHAVAQRCEI